MSEERKPIHTAESDQDWADLLSPGRRQLLVNTGLVAATLLTPSFSADALAAEQARPTPGATPPPAPPRPTPGKSPWGYETYKQPTPRPVSLRPGESTLPTTPRRYTDIKSYHAHVYFDEDTHEKAALIRKWAAERFNVELGDWNLEPRGPHVTPSFYFGFTNDLVPIIIPWLQLNSLGLTILLHPNTADPRADHLYYALWVNRSQPVNAYHWPKPEPGKEPEIEQIYPNTRPSVKLES
ncbi:DOPA 4,5-dioxygenase family protein [Cystobacter fuscus]